MTKTHADFFDLSTDFLCELDQDGGLLDVNQSFLTSLGYTRVEVIGKSLATFVDLPIQVRIADALAALPEQSSAHVDASMVHSDGKSLLVSWSFYRGQPGRVLAVGEDRGLEDVLGKVLQATLEKSASLLQAISDGFMIVDHQGIVVDINAEGERILQRSYGSLVGRSLLDEIPNIANTEVYTAFTLAIPDQQPVIVTEFYSFLDAWLQVRGYPTDEGYAIYFKDVTAQVEAEEKLRQSEERYRGIVDSQVDLVCRYLPDTTLTFVNDAYCEFFGKTRDELLGTSFLPLSAESHYDRILARLDELVNGAKQGVSEVPTKKSNGEVCWIEWVDHGIRDERGNVVAVQAVGRDITRAKKAEQERLYAQSLEAELATERELREFRERFISLVSHEFRTPLSIIRSSTQILMRYIDKLSPDRIAEKLMSVEEQVTRMFALMDDVLLISKGSAKKIAFQPERMNVADFSERLIESMRLSDQGRHHFSLTTQGLNGDVPLDRRLLEHILINLLSNAAKYSKEGAGVTLGVQQSEKGLCFTVKDEGIGIPQADADRLFQAFHRAGNVGNIAGTGLGLTIVKQSVEAHGGTVTYTSEVGKGTTFVVTIPLP
jgi:PAS domain S-box-containing protein